MICPQFLPDSFFRNCAAWCILDLFIYHLLPNTIAEPLLSLPEVLSPDFPLSIISQFVDTLNIEQKQLLTAIKLQFSPHNQRDSTWDITTLNASLKMAYCTQEIVHRFEGMVSAGVDNEYVDLVRYNPSNGISDLLVSYSLVLLLRLPLPS